MFTTKRFLLAMIVGLAVACGGKGDDKKPDVKATPDAKNPDAKGPDAKTPVDDTACKPGDPLCDPKFKQAGKVFDLPKDMKDVFYLPAPKQAPKDAPAGTASVVIFPHKSHATERLKMAAEKCGAMADVNACTTCHHKEIEKDSAEGFRKCSTCHKAEADAATKAPPAMEVFHKRCIGCHQELNEKCANAEPKFVTATKCEQCHKAAPGEAGATEVK
jgi:hypothetical protein